VNASADGHKKRVIQRKKEKSGEQRSLNEKYLREASQNKGSKEWSLVGHYVVECKAMEAFEASWLGEAKKMTLDLYETGDSDCLKAGFSFDATEGVMILGRQETDLIRYYACLEKCGSEYRSEEDCSDWSDENAED
jgi:hypothetical protein